MYGRPHTRRTARGPQATSTSFSRCRLLSFCRMLAAGAGVARAGGPMGPICGAGGRLVMRDAWVVGWPPDAAPVWSVCFVAGR